MATSVEKVIVDGGAYFVEGSVGLGKSFAYLLPALLHGNRIVIATPKKSLQDQIIKKDLPALMAATGLTTHDVACIVVKGKGNYACLKRAEIGKKATPDYMTFLRSSRYGDKADYPGTPPDWWPEATAEMCIGRSCEHASSCGYIRLRQELKQDVPAKKVIIINHHLLGIDLRLGLGTLIEGPYDVLIVDEAHKLVEGIRAAFTYKVTENVGSHITDLIQEADETFEHLGGLSASIVRLFEAVPHKYWKDPSDRKPPLFDNDLAIETLSQLKELKKEVSKRVGMDEDTGEIVEGTVLPDNRVYLERALQSIVETYAGIRVMQGYPYSAGEDEDQDAVDERNERYMENTVVYAPGGDKPGRFSLFASPIRLGSAMKPRLGAIKSLVLTSATLAVNESFDHVQSVVGVTPTQTDILPTSFNYGQQGVLYVPKHLPYFKRPKAGDEDATDRYEGYINAIGEECVFLTRLSKGNAFILTTANDEMERWARILKERSGQPVLMQTFRQKDGTLLGDGYPESLLRKYMETKGAILLGSKSFWEGVDVQGEKLSLVVIPKLPFPLSSDPVVKAREKATDNGFLNVDLVDMLIDVRQGAGRLIRSASDRGVVAILDSRIHTKGYGKQVLNALPFPKNVITSDRKAVEWYLPRVRKYFENLRPDGDEEE